jgi:hypothetical protein
VTLHQTTERPGVAGAFLLWLGVDAAERPH